MKFRQFIAEFMALYLSDKNVKRCSKRIQFNGCMLNFLYNIPASKMSAGKIDKKIKREPKVFHLNFRRYFI